MVLVSFQRKDFLELKKSLGEISHEKIHSDLAKEIQGKKFNLQQIYIFEEKNTLGICFYNESGQAIGFILGNKNVIAKPIIMRKEEVKPIMTIVFSPMGTICNFTKVVESMKVAKLLKFIYSLFQLTENYVRLLLDEAFFSLGDKFYGNINSIDFFGLLVGAKDLAVIFLASASKSDVIENGYIQDEKVRKVFEQYISESEFQEIKAQLEQAIIAEVGIDEETYRTSLSRLMEMRYQLEVHLPMLEKELRNQKDLIMTELASRRLNNTTMLDMLGPIMKTTLGVCLHYLNTSDTSETSNIITYLCFNFISNGDLTSLVMALAILGKLETITNGLH